MLHQNACYRNPMTRPDWRVLFIGGSSSTGKSTLALTLARRFDAHYFDADVLFVTLRNVLPPGAAPDGLHVQDEVFWSQPPDALIHLYLQLDTYICRVLETVVSFHHRKQRRLVLEGTWLLPAFTIQGTYDSLNLTGQTRCLFLYEPDADELEVRRLARADPWDRTFADDVMLNISTMRHRYGLVLKRQAEALNLPVLTSRPFGTLLDRALTALGIPQ
jgi:2-phosphoglycerate kinase